MIKYLAAAMVFYTFVSTGLAYFYTNTSFTVSVALGCFTMLVNLGGLVAFWRIIFTKKLIAFAALIIIFKYLILAIVLWVLYSIKSLSPIGFCVGLASLLFSILVLLVVKQFSKNIY